MSSSFIGKVVDNYRIIENLGIGGMGVVFKAIHVKLDKLFALKMIAPGLAMNENFIKRFQTEAKALAKFEDPNIVRIYDLREYNDQWFIVMEYVEGYNLLDIIRKKGAFPLQNAISILKQILTAIGHAHSAGIIHRDLKPNNVMISTDGKVKITDFGLAKDQTNTTTTLSVTSGGTLYYMSPEHVKGFQFTDKRSDIYSIGMTFYEMITGTVPFKDLQSDFDIRESIVRKETKEPSVYNEKIPSELENIVMKSISKEPDDRYQTTTEMLEAIQFFEAKDSNIESVFALVEIPDSGTNTVSGANSKKLRLQLVKSIFAENKRTLSIIGVLSSLIVLLILILYFLYPSSSFDKHIPNKLAEDSRLSISTQPTSAEIVIGKDTIGHSPINYYSLQPGQYSLLIFKNEYEPIDTTIVLNPGNKLSLSFSLKESEITGDVIESKTVSPPKSIRNVKAITKALIRIKSEPANAQIWINGKSMGTTPLNIADLSPGIYQLIIKKEGYLDYKNKIYLKSGQNSDLLANLPLLSGSLNITTDPPSARILLDGEEITNSRTPAKLEKIPVGKHKIEVQKTGYTSVTKEIEIKKGEILNKNISLIQQKGKLSIQVRPWGSIFINNDLKKESVDTKYEVTLPVEQYKIKVNHPTLGIWEKRIQIQPDTEEQIVVNFNRKIDVAIVAFDEEGSPLKADIYLDDKDTGKSTPAEVKINVGIHKVDLKLNGYNSIKEIKEIFVDNNEQNEHTIILKKSE
jgi:serine/threonine protein kinase